MRAADYIALEQQVTRAHRALGQLCEVGLRRHLNAADSILAEVRHYAVAVEDIRNTVKDANEQADLIRQADDRLLMFLAPKSF